MDICVLGGHLERKVRENRQVGEKHRNKSGAAIKKERKRREKSENHSGEGCWNKTLKGEQKREKTKEEKEWEECKYIVIEELDQWINTDLRAIVFLLFGICPGFASMYNRNCHIKNRLATLLSTNLTKHFWVRAYWSWASIKFNKAFWVRAYWD
ncbi:hypothetical protein C2G38_2033539 [Gigaspora rosea]|uniref:Uncharacterized protein n=1 Tax=Gigaspora rosea TaxID=44941 RepID=A0A397VKY5_9GLOM|nr:hypothetical protein C2G38_2033539 [Gigaspora rosea]